MVERKQYTSHNSQKSNATSPPKCLLMRQSR